MPSPSHRPSANRLLRALPGIPGRLGLASSRLLAPFVVLALGLHLPMARADEVAEIRALSAAGDTQSALRRVEAAVAAKPRDVPLRFLQGVVLMDAGRDAAALSVFTQLSQDYPELPDPHNNIALLHARAGKLEAALLAVQEALRAEPGHRIAMANLGHLHLMLAVRTWETLVQSGPVDATLLQRLNAARTLLASPAAGPR